MAQMSPSVLGVTGERNCEQGLGLHQHGSRMVIFADIVTERDKDVPICGVKVREALFQCDSNVKRVVDLKLLCSSSDFFAESVHLVIQLSSQRVKLPVSPA